MKRPSRRTSIASGVLLVVVAGVLIALSARGPSVTVTSRLVAGTPESGQPVSLDTSFFLPASRPAPAVLLAHGFGGSKADLVSQARSLARHGYVVMTYTARGFGASGGSIHLDSLQYEVADARLLVDALQTNPAVLVRDGKPVIGVAGSSYGGALALMLGSTDPQIGAVAADITWNDLAQALLPNKVLANTALANPALPNTALPSTAVGGVFKRLWAGYLFGGGFSKAGPASAAGDGPDPSLCGRFAADVCALYQQASATGVISPQFASVLARSSPSSVLSGMKSPTLLIQGEQDSLFDLAQADANYRQLRSAGAAVTMRWRAGGHDAGSSADNANGAERSFFDASLRNHAGSSAPFTLAQRDAAISAANGDRITTQLRARDGYPGVTGGSDSRRSIPVFGAPQRISAPAGGAPAAVTSIPGLGSVLGTASAAGLSGSLGLAEQPGQTAAFVSAPLRQPILITGASTVQLRFSARTDVVAFVSLHDLGPDGGDVLPAQLVSPIRLAASPVPVTVTVQLPAVVARVPSGHRLAVVVSTTDFAYLMPTDARTYTVGLGGSAAGPATGSAIVSVPAIRTVRLSSTGVTAWIVTAAAVVLLVLLLVWWRLRRRRRGSYDPALAGVPVVITDLVKQYADGYRAVDGVSFSVQQGQVLGLLGPNGAGKTTTLRVLMGLILPTEGSVRVFGAEVVPGAPVLSRLGAFVEGPGLLPHLTGAENLRLYWAASGRPPAEAELETVLEIAGLGASLQRRVKTYSHGMQQRLAIAQAMLGLPEVLVLDEPTNGLDPPQIAEMRTVLHRYAETGRTVIVSSHLLAEVEQTCTHVVVMHRGRLVAAGSVTEVARGAGTQLSVADPERAQAVLAAAGISAVPVPARRALEDVFLDLIGERHD